ncbi:hypothetical protein AVEN_160246-1, partial [Araneus ventricosus]
MWCSLGGNGYQRSAYEKVRREIRLQTKPDLSKTSHKTTVGGVHNACSFYLVATRSDDA